MLTIVNGKFDRFTTILLTMIMLKLHSMKSITLESAKPTRCTRFPTCARSEAQRRRIDEALRRRLGQLRIFAALVECGRRREHEQHRAKRPRVALAHPVQSLIRGGTGEAQAPRHPQAMRETVTVEQAVRGAVDGQDVHVGPCLG